MARNTIPREPRPTPCLPRSRARRRRDPPATPARRAVSRALGRGVGAPPAGAAHPRVGSCRRWRGTRSRANRGRPPVSPVLGRGVGAIPRRARRPARSPALSVAASAVSPAGAAHPRAGFREAMARNTIPREPRPTPAAPPVSVAASARFPARRRPRPSPARPDAASARSPGERGAPFRFHRGRRSNLAIPGRARRSRPSARSDSAPTAIPCDHGAPRCFRRARARRRSRSPQRGAPAVSCALGPGVGATPLSTAPPPPRRSRSVPSRSLAGIVLRAIC